MVADLFVDVPDIGSLSNVGKRSFGMSEFKGMADSNQLALRPIELSKHVGAEENIDPFLMEKCRVVDNQVGYIKPEKRNDPNEVRYLDKQIESYVLEHPEWIGRLNGGEIGSFLEFSLEMVKKGTGRHNDNANYEKISEAIDVNNPPETKCLVFNTLFKLVCERTMDRFNPNLRDEYFLLTTPGVAALDLPRFKSKSTVWKTITHSYLTLISAGEGRSVNFSTIDPYHAENFGNIYNRLDFTRERSVDSVNVLVDLLLVNGQDEYNKSSNREKRDLISAVVLGDMVSKIPDSNDAGEIGLILSTKWPEVCRNSRIFKGDYFREYGLMKSIIDHYLEEKGKVEEGKGSKPLLESYRENMYNKYENYRENYQNIRFRYDFYNKLKGEFQEAITLSAERVMNGLENNEEIDAKSVIIFFDLMDNIGYYGIAVDNSLWDRAIKITDEARELRGDGWRKMFNTSGTRRDWQNHLRRHFVNSWDMKPVETVITADDRETIDESDPHYKYVKFRASVLKLMKSSGVTGWEKYLTRDVPGGSYAELLVNTIEDTSN